MGLGVFAFVVSGSLALAAGRNECDRYLYGRRLRTLPVESNWSDLKILRTQNGQLLVAYQDDNYKVRVDDLLSKRTLWRQSTHNYIPKMALVQSSEGIIRVMLSRVIPDSRSDSNFIIETEVIQLPSQEKSLRQISLGPYRSQLMSHVVADNGEEIYFLQGERMMIVPVGGEALLLAPNEIANFEDVKLSGRGTPLVSVYNSNTVEILELQKGRLQSLWKTKADSHARIFGTPQGETLVAYRSRGRLIVQDPYANTTPPLILPSSCENISWHKTASGQILVATENTTGTQNWVEVHNLSANGRHLFRIAVETPPSSLAATWSSVPHGELFVLAADNTASVYHLMNDEAKLLKRYQVEIGPGATRFFNAKDTQYLFTPAALDGKVFVYKILKGLGESL